MQKDTLFDNEREERIGAIKEGASYRLAYEDWDFLSSDDLRSVRLQLELLKPEHYLRQNNVRSTIVVFGSARLLSPSQARKRLAEVEEAGRDDPEVDARIIHARRQLEYSRYYDEARYFSKTLSSRQHSLHGCHSIVNSQ